MKITKLYAAWLACIAIYQEQSAFDKVIQVGPDFVGIKQIGDLLTITPMGTIDKAMWESNFQIEPKSHPVFGDMHSGFLGAAEAIYAVIKPLVSGPVAFKGHSRGAALANILASLCALDGIPVAQLFLFECPNVGHKQYADFCAAQVTSGRIGFELETVNRLDPVPYFPVDPYTSSYPRTDLDHAPGGLEDANLIDWHIGATIYSGMLARFPDNAAASPHP